MVVAERRARAIWAIAVLVYVFAVFHRTSLGVAGLDAAERFTIGPAALGIFTVLQIGVYALMQVPTGLLVDRYGPRRVLTVAAVLMGLGQLIFAFAGSYPLALVARAVLGVGDAMAFVSVLRLIAAHYPARRYTLFAAITATLGAVGNLAATVPLTLLLHHAGWTVTFAVTGAATAAYAIVVALRVRDVPHGEPSQRSEAGTLGETLDQVRQVWRVAGTRLGFWVHFSTMFAPAVLGLLWGYPYLVQAQGLAPAAAGTVLSAMVVVAGVSGPIVGQTIGRRPEWRLPMVAGYLAVAVGLWGLLLGWPGGRVPVVVIAIAFSLMAVGGPLSGIAFALARDYNPIRRVGTATGVVNVGGFAAITITALAIGLLLGGDATKADTSAFRVAFLAVVAVLLIGSWRTAVWWRRARAEVFAAVERGEPVPVQIRRRAWDLHELRERAGSQRT